MALVVFAITLFVSAFLLFLVQPMIGKMILPKLGGTPQVWNTCMLFFQTVLLAGYFYTHAATNFLKPRMQMIVHGILLALPILVMLAAGRPFDVSGWTPPVGSNPIFATLFLLLIVVGVPFFVVSTSAPLLQRWFSFSGHPTAGDPYFLYGASNLGSLLSLGFYPFLMEPWFDVPTQTWVWFAGYVTLAVMIVGSAVLVWKEADTATTAGPAPETVAPNPLPAEAAPTADASTAIQPSKQIGKKKGLKAGAGTTTGAPTPSVARKPSYDATTAPMTAWRCIRWALLAAVPSSLMLGVTSYVSTDLSPFPLLWAIPLGLYLLSFILVFAKWPIEWTKEPHTLMLWLMPVFVIFLCMVLISRDYSPVGLSTAISFLSFFVITMALHGELAKDRPSPQHLTLFFLMMSVGGMLGGLFNALVAPIWFTGIVEYPLAIVLATLLRPNMVEHGWSDAAILDAMPDLRKSMVETSDNMSKSFGVKADGSPYVFSYILDVVIGGLVGLITYFVVMSNQRTMISGVFGFFKFIGLEVTRQWAGGVQRLAIYGIPIILTLLVLGRKVRFAIAIGCFILFSYYWTGDSRNTVYADRSYYGVLRIQKDTAYLRDYRDGSPRFSEVKNLPKFLKDEHDNDLYEEVPVKDNTGQVRKVNVATAPFNFLMHGSTYHGRNYQVPELSRLATTYYHRLGPVGVIMERFNWFPGEQNTWWADTRMPASLVGISAISAMGQMNLPLDTIANVWSEPPFATVGLGTGTMAGYVRPFQHMAYYEIDDKIKNMSRPEGKKDPYFRYVKEAGDRGGFVEIIMGDARLSLEKEEVREKLRQKTQPKEGDPNGNPSAMRDNYYHAIVLDAFSSDAIPVHLITKEAVKLYMDKLVKDGVLLVHTSNRHLQLIEPVADIALALGLDAWVGKDNGGVRDETSLDDEDAKAAAKSAVRSLGHFSSEYIMLARPGVLSKKKLDDAIRIPGVEHPSQVDWRQIRKYNKTTGQPAEDPHARIWTDQYQNIVSIMR